MALFLVYWFPKSNHFTPLVDTFKAISINIYKLLIASIIRPAAEFFCGSSTF